MSDNPPRTAAADGVVQAHADRRRDERRAFLRRTAVIAPVVLATVHGRSVWAQGAPPSGCASVNPSGWRARNPGNTCDPLTPEGAWDDPTLDPLDPGALDPPADGGGTLP